MNIIKIKKVKSENDDYECFKCDACILKGLQACNNFECSNDHYFVFAEEYNFELTEE